MENLEKLTVEKSKMLTKARGKDGHKNMSRKQRENTFTIPSTSIQPPKLASKPKKVYLFLKFCEFYTLVFEQIP